ncbi:MAG: hypothetical protein WC773_00165 [Patescibacteria group bacterium]|jgi:hypothetical protein
MKFIMGHAAIPTFLGYKRCIYKLLVLLMLFFSMFGGEVFALSALTKLANAAGPTTYYVDAATGLDTNDGKSEGAPWLTINKAATTLVAGDTVYIKNGVYREGVSFTVSGTSGSPITFSAYPEHSPVLDGGVAVSDWTLHAGNVYKTTWNYTSAGFWEDTTKLLTPNGAVPDAAGEWYLDDAGNTLYVWPSDSANPATHTYEASVPTVASTTSGNMLEMTGENYITINGLKTIHANNDGINMSGTSTGLVFNDVISEDNTYDGFSQHNTVRTTVTNITVNRNGKCNLVNVNDTYISLNGLSSTQGTYGPNAAASILFTENAAADIYDATIASGSHDLTSVFATAAGIVNLYDSTMTARASSYYLNCGEKTVFDRVVIDAQDTGARLYSGSNSSADAADKFIFRNSIAKNIGTDGFYITTANIKVLIENSIIIGQSSSNLLHAWGAGTTLEVYNTIIADNPLRTFKATSGTVTEDYNILYNSGGYSSVAAGAHTVATDPKFVNFAGGDYNIQSDSPAIDSGISTYSSTTDYAQNSRYDLPSTVNTGAGTYDYYDRGAYEYITPPTPAVSSASHPSQTTYYSDSTPDITITSDTSSTTLYRYLVDQTATRSAATVVASGTSIGTNTTFTVAAGIITSSGTWYIHVVAQNLDNDPGGVVNYTIKYDGSGPAAFAPTADPASWASANSSVVTFVTTDAESGVASYSVKIDSGAYMDSVASPYTLDTSALTDGARTVTIKATDNVGNLTTGTVTIYIDRTSPVSFTPTLNVDSVTSLTSAELSFITTDAGSGIEYYTVSVDSLAASTQVSPYSITGLSSGSHTATVIAYDVVGNTTSGSITWTVDTSVSETTSSTASTSTVPAFSLDKIGGVNISTTATRFTYWGHLPRFSGTADVGVSVVISTPSITLCSVVVDSAGNWECQSEQYLAFGEYAITARATNSIGLLTERTITLIAVEATSVATEPTSPATVSPTPTSATSASPTSMVTVSPGPISSADSGSKAKLPVLPNVIRYALEGLGSLIVGFLLARRYYFNNNT